MVSSSPKPDEIARVSDGLTAAWCASPYEIHKRPPYRAHSFDGDDRFWVVGSTNVSVLHGWHGPEVVASAIAASLNASPAIRAHLLSTGADHDR